MLFALVVGCGEWMSRSESLLLKVQGGELDVDRVSWLEPRWRTWTETAALKAAAAWRVRFARRSLGNRLSSVRFVWGFLRNR